MTSKGVMMKLKFLQSSHAGPFAGQLACIGMVQHPLVWAAEPFSFHPKVRCDASNPGLCCAAVGVCIGTL